MEQEDAIVVTPPTETEVEQDNSVTPVDGPRGTANATTGTEPQAQPTYTFTKRDIKAIANEALQEAVDKGEFDDIVEANPTLEGSEPDLESLKVGGVKYKVGGGTNVVANPTLAGTESDLEGLEVGSTKYAVPPRVSANPTLAGTETTLEGLQIGNVKYKAGGGAQKYLHIIGLTAYDYSSMVATRMLLFYVSDVATACNNASSLYSLVGSSFNNTTPSYQVTTNIAGGSSSGILPFSSKTITINTIGDGYITGYAAGRIYKVQTAVVSDEVKLVTSYTQESGAITVNFSKDTVVAV